METFKADVAIIGAGGAGLRAAIAVAEADPTLTVLAIELGYLLDVAQAMAHSAINRREWRGSHQRLDGFETRDDVNFLKHTLAWHNGDDPPRITYGPVKITTSQPGTRAYGAAGEKAEAEREAQEVFNVD